MNADQFFGSMEEFRGAIEKWWGGVTGTETTKLKGEAKEVIGFVQDKFGVAKTEAIRQVRDLFVANRYIQNNWDHYESYARDHWGEDLTDEELAKMAKGITGLVGTLEAKYGSADEAKRQIIDSIKSVSFEKWKRENHEKWKDAEHDVHEIEREFNEALRQAKETLAKDVREGKHDLREIAGDVKRDAREAAHQVKSDARQDAHQAKEAVRDASKDM